VNTITGSWKGKDYEKVKDEKWRKEGEKEKVSVVVERKRHTALRRK